VDLTVLACLAVLAWYVAYGIPSLVALWRATGLSVPLGPAWRAAYEDFRAAATWGDRATQFFNHSPTFLRSLFGGVGIGGVIVAGFGAIGGICSGAEELKATYDFLLRLWDRVFGPPRSSTTSKSGAPAILAARVSFGSRLVARRFCRDLD
jgi:hypothetical protein